MDKEETGEDNSKQCAEKRDSPSPKPAMVSPGSKDRVYICARARTPVDEDNVESEVHEIQQSRPSGKYYIEKEKSKRNVMCLWDSDTESEDSFLEEGQKFVEAEVHRFGLNSETRELKEVETISPKPEKRGNSDSLPKELTQSDIEFIGECEFDIQSKKQTHDFQSMEEDENYLPSYHKYIHRGRTGPYVLAYKQYVADEHGNESTRVIYVPEEYLSGFMSQSGEYFIHYPGFIIDEDSSTLSSCNISDTLCPWFHCGPLDIKSICLNIRAKVIKPKREGIEVDLSPKKPRTRPFHQFKCVNSLRRKRQISKEKASRKASRKIIRESFNARNQTIEIETIRNMILYMTSVPGTKLEAEELARHMNGPQLTEELRVYQEEIQRRLDLLSNTQKHFESSLQQLCEKAKAIVDLYDEYESKSQDASSISTSDSSETFADLTYLYSDRRIILQEVASNFCDLQGEFYEEFQKSIELYNEKRIAVKRYRDRFLDNRIYKLCKLDPPPTF